MFDSIHPITGIIILITSLFSYKGWKESYFFEKYKFQIAPIKYNKEHLRMLTSGLLHVDGTHLIFNMLTLYFFADVVIGVGNFQMIGLGVVYFVLVYILSLIGGNILSFIYHKNQSYYSAVGASGAVSGIVYSSIILYPYGKMGLLFIPIYLDSWIFGILYLLFTIYGMKKQLGNIGHAAHLGGALTGLLVTLFLKPDLLVAYPFIIAAMICPIFILLYPKFKK